MPYKRVDKKDMMGYEKKDKEVKDYSDEIISFFKKHPYPDDEKIHKFAEKLGVEPDDFEGQVYKVLSSLLDEGKSKNFSGEYDPVQVEKGIQVEMEHTTNPEISRKIAYDHLAEHPRYYDYLESMEKLMKRAK